MVIQVKHLFFAGFLLIAANSKAQKDSMHLVCPFEHGSGKEPKEPYSWDPSDKKVIMTSHVDSLIRSSVAGKVSNVEPGDDGMFEIVIYKGDFYFWYSYVAKPLVTRGQVVKAGETIGLYKFGTELEFRMFKDEESLDPRNMLECKVPKAEY